jgi:DNA-binding protein HU-beta
VRLNFVLDTAHSVDGSHPLGTLVSGMWGSITLCSLTFDRRGVPVPLTQTQLPSAVADRAELSNTDAKRALAALEEIVLEQLGNAEKVRIGGMVQLTVRVKPAQKKRLGRNPATGEEITIAAKPASVDLRADRSRKRRQRCHRCRKHAGASPRNPVFRPKPVGAPWKGLLP